MPQAQLGLFPFTVARLRPDGPHRAYRAVRLAVPRTTALPSVLDSLGIAHLADRPYTEVSGGERQLALVARALAQEPTILVMDEPTASLDFGNQVRVLARSTWRARASRIVSTHDPTRPSSLASRGAAPRGPARATRPARRR